MGSLRGEDALSHGHGGQGISLLQGEGKVTTIDFGHTKAPFSLYSFQIVLECTLDKEVYYHGQEMPVHVSVNNNSKKSVKAIRVKRGRDCCFLLFCLLRVSFLIRIERGRAGRQVCVYRYVGHPLVIPTPPAIDEEASMR